jgi:hypothetical protein
MQCNRTVKALLAANAVLLGAIAWIERDRLLPAATAAGSTDGTDSGKGVANVAARQRQTMIERLDAIEARLGGLDRLLRDGTLRVEIASEEAAR